MRPSTSIWFTLLQRPEASLLRRLSAAMFVAAYLSSPVLQAAAPPAATPVALTVNAIVVKATNVARTIAVTGSIFAWQEIIIGPEVGGYRVDAVQVEVGDKVKRGQELIRLSGSMLQAEAASRRAALKQAEAQLVNASAAYKRAETLSTSAVFSKADLDRLLSEQLAAQGRVDAARADLDLAELKLRYTRVVAPYDGIITARTVNVGQVAQAGSEMLRLLRDGRMEWRGEVPEARLRDLKVGQIAHLVTADGSEFDGKVRIVAPTVASNNRMGLVYVDIAPGAAARPGMFARGAIETSAGQANLVPLSAVVAQDGYSYVFVLIDGDKVEKRRVQVGDLHGDEIEVMEGLKAGERIVGKGAAFLKNGDQVKVVAGA